MPTSQIITENILEPNNFLYATEQLEPYIGQPDPYSDNEGLLRLISSGDVTDFVYSGTATSNGATNVMIDSLLQRYGDNWFNGATITFVAGANPSGSTTITDFFQSGASLFWQSGVTPTTSGDSYELRIPYSNRDFRIELISSGDVGDATFKWSGDGGSNFFGRNNPNQADWPYLEVVSPSGVSVESLGWGKSVVLETSENNLYIAYTKRNTPGGITFGVYGRELDKKTLLWGDEIAISQDAFDTAYGYWYGDSICYDGIVLDSGRILLSVARISAFFHYLFYSDDNGVNWNVLSFRPTAWPITSFEVLSNKNVGAVFNKENPPGMFTGYTVSSDNGKTWSTEVSVSDDAYSPSLVQAQNGDLICAYHIAPGATYEIYAKISKDFGATWGGSTTVLSCNDDIYAASLIKDINGDIYCVASVYPDAIISISDDNGQNWSASKTIITNTNSYTHNLNIFDGHNMLCIYSNTTQPTSVELVHSGMWESYESFPDSNPCPIAVDAQSQVLINDVKLKTYGGGGIDGDQWIFSPEYQYSIENLIDDSPRKVWRSETTAACEIILDMRSNERLYSDAVGLFNCNMRSCSVEFNATNEWDSPSVSKNVFFDIDTGTVDSVSGNAIEDSSFLNNYKDHELSKNYYLRMTSGTDNGKTWKIKDNINNYIILDTSASNDISALDTFLIYQNHICDSFVGGVYRYIRIYIESQNVSDDYFQIGSMVLGGLTTFNNTWSGLDYSRSHQYNIDYIESISGNRRPFKKSEKRRIFKLFWDRSEISREEVVSAIDYTDGKNLVLIPDSDTTKTCYLVKRDSDIQERFKYKERWDLSVSFREQV